MTSRVQRLSHNGLAQGRESDKLIVRFPPTFDHSLFRSRGTMTADTSAQTSVRVRVSASIQKPRRALRVSMGLCQARQHHGGHARAGERSTGLSSGVGALQRHGYEIAGADPAERSGGKLVSRWTSFMVQLQPSFPDSHRSRRNGLTLYSSRRPNSPDAFWQKPLGEGYPALSLGPALGPSGW